MMGNLCFVMCGVFSMSLTDASAELTLVVPWLIWVE